LSHRYLVITELYLPTKGGTAVWFDEVYRRIGGKEIHVVTADVPGAAEHDASHANSVHRVGLARHRWLRPESLAMYVKLLAKSLSLALSNRFDAVHAGRVLPEGLVAWVVARLIRKPLVVYAHGEEITTWRQPAKLRAMAFVYHHADRVVANSDFTREELLKLGVKAERIVLIHPGVDVDRFTGGLETKDLLQSLGLSNKQKLIVSTGRLSRRKGFDQVIRALLGLVSDGVDAHYAIIGIGEDDRYLRDLANSEGVQDRVHMLGHVSAEDLPRWFNAADVFAMPNREINGDNEGFGMVFIEAGACGTPVVAGKAGGTGSAVVDGETGFRVDGADVMQVAKSLRSLCEDSELASRMGQLASFRVREHFSWLNVAERTVSLMSRIDEERRKGL